MLIPTRPWPRIVAFYRDLPPSFAPVLALAEQIAATWYGQLLHGFTSMSTLIVGVTPLLTFADDVLHISLAPHQQIQLIHWEHAAAKRQWQRTCADSEVWSVFTTFVTRHRWLTIDPLMAARLYPPHLRRDGAEQP